MEQEIRLCKTSDGVSLAYAVVGAGPPLVYVCGWPGHLVKEWETPFAREFLESFASALTLVRYDMRSSGLSEEADDVSLPALVRDLEAVVDDLQLEQFSLMSLGLLGGPVAFTYASAHPDRVSNIITSSPFISGSRLLSEEQFKAISGYASAFGEIVTPDDFAASDGQRLDPADLRQAGDIHSAGASPGLLSQLIETLYRSDLSDAAARCNHPVLVLHGSGDGRVSLDVSREFASSLPNVKFVPYDGTGVAPWADRDVLLPEIFRFLGVEPPEPKTKAPPAPGGFATILFTDMEGSTTLADRLGDAAAQEVRRAHNDIVRSALAANGGSEVKHTGDGIMASFSTASSALTCAIAIQRGVAAHKEEHPDSPLGVYVGLNAGEPIAEEDPGGRVDLFGTSINLAARICDHAQAGQIVAANVVRELAAGKQFLFADLGETALRGFEDPVKLWELRWRGSD